VRNRSNSRISATAGIIGRNPREAVGLFAMGAAVTIIFVNALFMQKGPHPAPIFAPKQAVTPMPLSRFMPPAPPPVSQGQAVAVPAPAPRPHIEQAPARANDPIAALLAPSNRVTAAQQVLTQYGYGQIRPNGVVGPDTQEAIRRFERSQKMPVTGQMSDQVVKALAQMSGRSLD
jgi:hypothetical protein